MKTNEQVYLEAQDSLERRLEALHQEKARIENEITRLETLLKRIPDIYEQV
jgi:hypothetical protein